MVPRKPDLSQVGRHPVLWKPLPYGRTEGRASLVKSERMERMLNAIGQTGVMPIICAMNVSFVKCQDEEGALIRHYPAGCRSCRATKLEEHRDCPQYPKHRRL
jgi:hypothetical protein